MLRRTIVLGVLLAILWALEAADQWVFDGSLDGYGIKPRSWSGLWGIIFAPFLHGGFGHLAANSAPFLILGWLVMLRGSGVFFEVSLGILALGGLGVWLIGDKGSVHLGASGVIFGYFGFLLFRGFLDRSIFSAGVSIAVAIAYGGLIWGVLPGDPGISWQGHLSGFVAGLLLARLDDGSAGESGKERMSGK